jgi:hypothetical protein
MTLFYLAIQFLPLYSIQLSENVSTMTGMDSLTLTINKLADMQIESILGKDILLLPPVYEGFLGLLASDAAVEWAPCTETGHRNLSEPQHLSATLSSLNTRVKLRINTRHVVLQFAFAAPTILCLQTFSGALK